MLGERSPGACAALLSPGPTRRFPFSAALRTRRRVSFRPGDGQMGRLPNDHQSQRALGIDSANRTSCGFRAAIAGGAGCQNCGRQLQIRNGHGGADQAQQIYQARRAPRQKEHTAKIPQGGVEILQQPEGDGGCRREPQRFHRDPAIGRQRQRATALPGGPRRQRPGHVRRRPTRCCRSPRTSPPTRNRPPRPLSSPPTSSTRSTAALQEAPSAAPTLALASAEAPAAAAPVLASSKDRFRLGPDLADREDLHRLRRAADGGLRRAHVHGVRASIPGTMHLRRERRCTAPGTASPLEAHPASGHIARAIRAPGWTMSTFEHIIVESQRRGRHHYAESPEDAQCAVLRRVPGNRRRGRRSRGRRQDRLHPADRQRKGLCGGRRHQGNAAENLYRHVFQRFHRDRRRPRRQLAASRPSPPSAAMRSAAAANSP